MGNKNDPFRGGLSDSFSRIMEQQKRLEKALCPPLAFKDQMESIVGSSSAIKNFHISTMIKEIDPLQDFRDQFATSNLLDKMELWREALEVQNSFELPEHVRKAISGVNFNKDIFKNLAVDTERLSNVISALNYDSIFLGEYEIEEEGEDAEEPVIFLPEKFNSGLQAVNYLPIKLFQRIVSDPSLMRDVSPRDFEFFVAELIGKLGFKDVNVTPRSGDGGRDIIATKEVNGIPMLFAFECKKYKPGRKIQLDIMRALLGTVVQKNTQANIGILVTTSSFTSGARKFIASEALLDGKDFGDLVDWINNIRFN